MQISTHQGWAALQGSLHHCLGQVPLERASGREMCRELGCQGAFSRTTPARELGKIRKQRLSREGLVRGTMNLWCSYMRGSGGPTGSSEAGMGFHRCHRLKLGECAFYLCEHQIGTVSGEECNLGWGDSWNWNNFQAGVRVKGPYISQQTWKGHPGNESRVLKGWRGNVYMRSTPQHPLQGLVTRFHLLTPQYHWCLEAAVFLLLEYLSNKN